MPHTSGRCLNTGRTHFKKGHEPWNKGGRLSSETKRRISIAKLGSPAWNKGITAWWVKGSNNWKWKGGRPHCIGCGVGLPSYLSIKCRNCYLSNIENERNPNWKGDNVGYRSLHYWVYKHKGDPNTCAFCGTDLKLNWANRSGEYKRDINDWISLCVSCHRKYDGERVVI